MEVGGERKDAQVHRKNIYAPFFHKIHNDLALVFARHRAMLSATYSSQNDPEMSW